jgi:hypothetical protein
MSAFFNEPVTENSATVLFELQWMPLHVALSDTTRFVLGPELAYGYSPTTQSSSMEDPLSNVEPGGLHRVNFGVALGIDYRHASKFGLGLMLSGGFKHYSASDVDLGGYGSQQSLSINTGYINAKIDLGWSGIHPFLGVGMDFGTGQSFGGMTDADMGAYSYGVGNIHGKVNWLVSAGIKFILPDLMKIAD